MARFDTGILRLELIQQDYSNAEGYSADYNIVINCGRCGLKGQMEMHWPPEGYSGERVKNSWHTMEEKAWVYAGEVATFSCSHVEKNLDRSLNNSSKI